MTQTLATCVIEDIFNNFEVGQGFESLVMCVVI